MRPRVLFGAHAYNDHVQQIARALYEADALGVYQSGGVDHYSTTWGRKLRSLIEQAFPYLDRQLRRRRISAVPGSHVRSDWTWELLRTAAARLDLMRLEDWLWERSEWKLDRDLAARLQRPEFDAFFGVEHGSLAALRAAQRMGKPGILGYMSPHHTALKKWVYREFEQFPELLTPARKAVLSRRQSRRYDRKDEETACADFIHTNSDFSKRTLVEAGVNPNKIYSVPLGCPPAKKNALSSPTNRKIARIIFAGNLSIRKGFHYLIDAWSQIKPTNQAELHCFGKLTAPRYVIRGAPSSVIFHGRVDQETLFEAFRTASVLVLPTLLDGFGMVVSEALAHGLPVITTPNAGAADLIQEGENGFLVSPRDTDALARRIEWVLTNPEKVHSMREAAVQTAASWSWSDFRTTLRRQLDDTFGWSLTEKVQNGR